MDSAPSLDVLALAAHPDDAELAVGGTMALLASQGYRTGVIDFTRGELGSRGTPKLRANEVAEASQILNLSFRANLGLADGDIENSPASRQELIDLIRRLRPSICLIGAPDCRHPDHVAATKLSVDALFYAGLRRIESADETLEPWRPLHVLHYMQSITFEPTIVVDVTEVWDTRIEALRAFKSQFHNPDYEASDDEPETFVSNESFLDWVEARARTYGYRVGATFGEPLLYRHGPFGVQDLVATLDSRDRFR